MDVSAGLVDRACRGDERLTGNLTTEHALAVLVGLDAAEDIHLDRLEVEEFDEIRQCVSHPVMLPRRPGTTGLCAQSTGRVRAALASTRHGA